MIISLLCDLIKALLLFIIGLFPDTPSVDFFAANIQPITRLFGGINLVVSVSLLGKCLVAILLFYNIRFIWSIVMWVVRKIPGVS